MSEQATVGLGLVGLGNWGEKLARTFSRVERATLRAVCDVAPGARDRAESLASRPAVESRFEDVLARADTGAIVIATPPASHAELALRALEAGRDVFLEKPMALCLDDAVALEEAARSRGRVLMIGHILEYHPALVELRRRIAAGELGEVELIVSERLGPSPRRHEDAWWSLGPHDVSVMRMLLGHEPTLVSAKGWELDAPGRADVVTARIDTPRAIGFAHLSTAAKHKVRRIAVVGSERVALFDDLDKGRELRLIDRERIDALGAVLDAARALRTSELGLEDALDGIALSRWLPEGGGEPVPVAGHEPLLLEAEHFVAGVLDRSAVRSDAASGRQVVAVLTAGAASLLSGGSPVAVPRGATSG